MWLQAERLLQEAARAATDGDSTRPPSSAPATPPKEARRTAYRSPEDVTDDDLLDALRTHHWKIQRAAAELGISRGFERTEDRRLSALFRGLGWVATGLA